MTDAEYDYLFRDADPRWQAYYRIQREEYRKKHPLTNFEAWRDSLTPETFYEMREAICFLFNRAWPCSQCPAWDYCSGDFSSNGCKGTFTAWANSPAKEEEK